VERKTINLLARIYWNHLNVDRYFVRFWFSRLLALTLLKRYNISK